MLIRNHEYEKMAGVELEHWWYRTLHWLVLDTLEQTFPTRDIEILDAGCGTGGLLLHLYQRGYRHIQGFDLSEDAVRFSAERGLRVELRDLRHLQEAFPGKQFDAILSNDTLYFLQRQEIRTFLAACVDRLSPGGLLMLNLPVFKAFRGIHDLSVGINRRFSKEEIRAYFEDGPLGVIRRLYWPLVLSPVVLLVRTLQRVRMRLWPSTPIRSDIDIPPGPINSLLESICRWDIQQLGYRPFGSSLFLVLQKPLRSAVESGQVPPQQPGDSWGWSAGSLPR